MTDPHPSNDLADSGLAGDRLRRRWKTVLLFAVAGALISVLITAIRKPVFAARMSVFFPARSSVLGTNGVMDAASSAGSAMLGGGPSPIRVFQAFLESQTALQDLSTEFGMTRQKLSDDRAVDSDTRSNVLTVTMLDQDPERARKILEKHVDELKKINAKVSFDTLEDDLKVLDKRLDGAKQKMAQAETSLVAYERKSVSAPTIAPSASGIAATPGAWAQNLIQLQLEEEKIDRTLAASKSRVQTLAKLSPEMPSELPPIKHLRPKLLDTEYELQVKRQNLGPDAPEVRHLETQLQVTKDELSRELTAYLKGVDANQIDPTVAEGDVPALLTSRTVMDAQISVLRKLAAAAPAESMQMNRLYAEVNLQAGLVQQLTNQYLAASLQAQRDPNRWVVLDEPWVDEKPVNKSLGRAALIGGFLGLVLGLGFAVSWRT